MTSECAREVMKASMHERLYHPCSHGVETVIDTLLVVVWRLSRVLHVFLL